MAKYYLFGSLVQVPSAFLNAIQEAVYAQRAVSSANQLGLSLDGVGPSFNQRRVVFAADQPAVLVGSPLVLDESIDWRDRHIRVRWKFDTVFDIRPGKSDDFKYPEEDGTLSYYTGVGGSTVPVSPLWGLTINSTNGKAVFYKRAGFLYVEIESGTQLKERS